MEELAAMQSMKGTTTGSGLFTEVNGYFGQVGTNMGLSW